VLCGVVWWMEVFPLFLLNAQVEREGWIESFGNKGSASRSLSVRSGLE